MESWKAKLIVVGVDGSDASVDAALVAASLARGVGASLHIVTVVKPPEGWWGIIESPPTASALGKALEEAQRKVLDLTTARVDLTGIDHQTVEEIGDPGRSLAAYCDEHDADLLVIGRHGAGLFDRLAIGSVTNRLLHDSPCPVMVVP